MAAYLIAEEGPLTGLVIHFDEGQSWIIGRDPDQADIVLEDTTVSRRHAEVTRTSEGIYLKNISQTNPLLINEEEISGQVLLKDGDRIHIGQNIFLFSEEEPLPEEEEPLSENGEEKEKKSEASEGGYDDIFGSLEEPEKAPSEKKKKKTEKEHGEHSVYDTIFEEAEEEIPFHLFSDTPLILKVISGPNAGAEIGIEKNKTYLIGKDPNSCEIVFQDLSVSRNHVRLIVGPNSELTIEDLSSKNGTRVNGILIEEKKTISSQDLVACGTTTFIILDKEAAQETIYSPSFPSVEEPMYEEEEEIEEGSDLPVNWKERIIPTKYLIASASFALILLIMFMSFFSLFKAQRVLVAKVNYHQEITEALQKFGDVQYSFNPITGRLFLTGHVLTSIDREELVYNLHSLSFIRSIEDNVIIDELIWKNANSVLVENGRWPGVNIYATNAGRFVITGYLQTFTQADQLDDFLNTHFPYLDLLENRVYIDQGLDLQIQSLLQAEGFDGVQFQQSNGSVILTGYFDEMKEGQYNELLTALENTAGIRSVQSLAIASTASTARIDLSQDYQVTGFAKYDGQNYSIVINGRILTMGDNLDGLDITNILGDMILLEKDGLKYKIDYNR